MSSTSNEFFKNSQDSTKIFNVTRFVVYVYNIKSHAHLILFTLNSGSPIPRVEYTTEEVSTWKTIYSNLKKLFTTHACSEFNHILPLLEENCGYSENSIPQLQDVSDFMKCKFSSSSKKLLTAGIQIYPIREILYRGRLT